jgi:ABC-type sugar transport system permease subunit
MDDIQRLPNKRSKFRLSTNLRNTGTALLFLLPVTVLIIWIMGIPIVQSLIRSVQDMQGNWIGFKNYNLFFHETRFYSNVLNTLKYAASVIILIVPTGLLAAHLIVDKSRVVSILRPLYLIPWVTPYICSAILFRSMFIGLGPVTAIIKWIFGTDIIILALPGTALVAVILHQFWRSVPFAMLFTAAGLTTIPKELYEAGTIDGANRWRQFLHITLPILKPHLFIVTLMVTNGALQDSEAIYGITGGGPGTSTETIALRLFKGSIQNFDMNSASVLGVILLFIASIFIFLYSRVIKSMEEDIYE